MNKLSYVYGPSKIGQPLFTTIPRLLEFRVKANPDKPAHIFRTLKTKESTETNRVVVTFKELADRSLSVASSFLVLGIKPHDKVAMIGSNCPEFLYVDYACVRISVLMIRMPASLLVADVILDALGQHEVKALILDDMTMASRLDGILPGILERASRTAKYSLPSLDHVILLKETSSNRVIDLLHVEDLIKSSPNEEVSKIQNDQDPEDAALVYPTSGSSGKPKFVLHTHFSVINGTGPSAFGFSNSDNNVFFCCRPFSWIGGLTMNAAVVGTTMLFYDTVKHVTSNWMKTFLSIVDEEKVTTFGSMPHVIHDLCKSANEEISMPQITLLTGGELVPWEVLRFALNNFPTVSLGYGTTELLSVARSRVTLLEDKDEGIYWMKPSALVHIKVVGDNQKVLPINTVGHIRVKAPAMMKCYLDNPDATNSAFDKDGWLKTGDIGLINDVGELKVIGRSSDVISRGTGKIYPIAIENMLLKSDDVQEVSVVDVPDSRLFNEICACVIPKAMSVVTPETLGEFCRQQTVTDTTLLTPKYYLLMDEFPRTNTGKVHKRELRRAAMKILELEG